VSEQSWQASRAESAELVAAVRRGMYVPHEGLQVRTTVQSLKNLLVLIFGIF